MACAAESTQQLDEASFVDPVASQGFVRREQGRGEIGQGCSRGPDVQMPFHNVEDCKEQWTRRVRLQNHAEVLWAGSV